ncbi:MAG: GNAT family N-acetyltransferase [Saprospiraceae bacterium]|nr:GNAT family N-acetyltransferase [Saprospiraceae bacterium]
MTNIFLRRATKVDLPLIRQLAERIWWEHYPSIISDEQIGFMLELIYSDSALQQQMEEEGQEFWLPEINGKVLGFLSVSRKGEGDYFIHKFYLDTRERGFGTIVFELLLARYPDLCELRLRVNRRNFKSVNFYFKVGFRIEYCIDMPIGEGYVMDDFQMVYPCSPYTPIPIS